MEPNITSSPAYLAAKAAFRVVNTPPVFYVFMFTACATFFIFSMSASFLNDSSASIFIPVFYFIYYHLSILLISKSNGCST